MTELLVAFLGQSTALVAGVTVLFWAIAGVAAASYGRVSLWIGGVAGGLVPVIGAMVLLIVGTTRRTGARQPVVGRSLRIVFISAGAAFTALIAATLVMGWLSVTTAVPGIGLSLQPWGSGVDAFVLLTVVMFAVALVGVWFWFPRLAATVTAWFALWWLLIGLGGIIAQNTIVQALEQLGVARFTAEQLTTLVQSLDVTALESAGIDVNSLDMADLLASVTVGIGPAWPVLVAVGTVALLWSLALVVCGHLADRPSPRPAAR